MYVCIYIYIYIYRYIYIYIYILQPTPLSQLYVAPPHSSKVRAKGTKWCIHVVDRAKLGQNGLKTGSKRAKNTCLSMPNGPGSLLEKRVFDPFLTHSWSQNGPFSRHFGIFHEPKPVATGSKWAKTTCLSIINGP